MNATRCYVAGLLRLMPSVRQTVGLGVPLSSASVTTAIFGVNGDGRTARASAPPPPKGPSTAGLVARAEPSRVPLRRSAPAALEDFNLDFHRQLKCSCGPTKLGAGPSQF